MLGECCRGCVPHKASGHGLSYAAGTSSIGAAHDEDVPDWGLDLNIMVDVLS
jgi:hypothetical protein